METIEDIMPHDVINHAYSIGMSQVESEITEFTEFLRTIRPTNVMEIGSKLGGNFYILCKYSSGIRISVDMPGGKHGGWILDHPYLGSVIKKRNDYFKSKFDNVYMITGDSTYVSTKLKVEEALKEKKLDILFIDGNHNYHGVKKDFETYESMVNDNGYIVFHDINNTKFHREINVNVAKLWNELKGKKRVFNANKHWAGIGVITKWRYNV